MASSSDPAPLLPRSLRARLLAWLRGMAGYALLAACIAAGASLLTWSAADPSYVRTASGPIRNALGPAGANVSDLAMRLLGLASVIMILPPVFWALQLITRRQLDDGRVKVMLAPVAVLLLACALAALPVPSTWPLPYGLGGWLGDQSLRFLASLALAATPAFASAGAGVICLAGGLILLTGSLGMSLQDLRLLFIGARPRSNLAARAWRGISGAFDRPEPPVFERREPSFGLPPEAPVPQGPMTVGHRTFRPPQPSFGYEPLQGRTAARPAPRPGKRAGLRRPVQQDPEFDEATDTRSRAMAQRFAPSHDEPDTVWGFGAFRRRRGGPSRPGGQEEAPKPRDRSADHRPIWPGSVPVAADEAMDAAEPFAKPVRRPASDELYGRAVALIRAQRKASAQYLQQSLGIGYMRAADLIDRMEREGIIGAPVQDGIRPILTAPPGTHIV